MSHQHPHDDEHGHEHEHPPGVRGLLAGLFAPHSHDAADSLDDALQSSVAGVRAVKVSLVVLSLTALAQLVIVAVSGSVALLADTIHNFSDALTAVPLWIAFVLGRRAATRRYTYGYGRAEDLAGLFVVAMIALSAVVAGVEAVRRLLDPQPIEHLALVALAGVVGFVGNEWVAQHRNRVGRRARGSSARPHRRRTSTARPRRPPRTARPAPRHRLAATPPAVSRRNGCVTRPPNHLWTAPADAGAGTRPQVDSGTPPAARTQAATSPRADTSPWSSASRARPQFRP